MANERFSKKTVQAGLQLYMDGIQKTYGFDPGNGTAQIPFIARQRQLETGEQFDYHLQRTTFAYGRFEMIQTLATEFGLTVYTIPEGYCKKQFGHEGRLYERVVEKA